MGCSGIALVLEHVDRRVQTLNNAIYQLSVNESSHLMQLLSTVVFNVLVVKKSIIYSVGHIEINGL